ncbi:MAG: InlB B-repeat-containing protein [Clostridiales Family XIII bacterium]|jgi:hypothetical protein|nr:InlB B-repeat-containing protein [Clostridiales Family XIII bacterium]
MTKTIEKREHWKKIVNALAIMLIFVGVLGFIPEEKVNADSFDGIVYTVKSESEGDYGAGAYVTGYNGDETSLTIPKTLGGSAVVSVNLSSNDYYNDNSSIKSLNLSSCTEVRGINVNSCSDLTSLNLTGLTKLEVLSCNYNTSLKSLNLTGLTDLSSVYCSNNSNLASLNLTGLTKLEDLSCNYNTSLKVLNLTGLTNLSYVDCQYNKINNLILNLTELTNLTGFYCERNYITNATLITALVNKFTTSAILPQYGYDIFLIKFDANDGIGVFKEMDVWKNGTIGVLGIPHYRDGYNYAGWWTAKTGGTRVLPTTKPTKNMTIYTHWTKIVPKIKITKNSSSTVVDAPANKKTVKFIRSKKSIKRGKTGTIKLTSYNNVTVKTVKMGKSTKKFITVKKVKNGIKVKVSKKAKKGKKYTVTVTLKNGNKKLIKITAK